jgi:hypothetical protein
MPWWEYEPDKKYPWVPFERSRSGDFRIPASIVCLVAAIASMLGAIAAFFMGASFAGGWGVALSIALTCASYWLMPSGKRSR